MKTFLIRISCDGSTNDDIIFGDFDLMINRFLELSWFGTREEALKPENMGEAVQRIRDIEMNWVDGRFDEQVEQGYVLIIELQNENIIEQSIKNATGIIGGIKIVRHFSKGLASLKKSKEYVEKIKGLVQ